MWVWLRGKDQPENLHIPSNAPSSTGEYDSLRSEISYYWHAVDEYLATGDDTKLRNFVGAYIEVDGQRYGFNLDTDQLEEAGSAADLSFESIDSGSDA